MSIKTRPFSGIQQVHWGSDIASLSFDGSGLKVVVAREPVGAGFKGLSVTFSSASAFRYLDESDLARYWISEGFRRGHHVLEVDAGGWLTEERRSAGHEFERREWLVVTGNGCVSVFAPDEPAIEEMQQAS